MIKHCRNQAGQVLVLLILVMAVALATGLSIIQKSISDISTASKVEQSTRAFSAAEAGVEKALKGDNSGVSFPQNHAQATVNDQGLLPAVPGPNSRQAALEYPPLAKEDVAQIWLTDYKSSANPPLCTSGKPCYDPPSHTLDIYWGSNNQNDQAALVLTLVYWEDRSYKIRQWYLDHSTNRVPDNGFDKLPCLGYTVGLNTYQCKISLGEGDLSNGHNDPLPSNLMLIRAKLLYNSTSQPLAVQAVGTCGLSCDLPPQARVIYSTGVSGETQRRVKVFTQDRIVPPYFDYSVFSTGEIKK